LGLQIVPCVGVIGGHMTSLNVGK